MMEGCRRSTPCLQAKRPDRLTWAAAEAGGHLIFAETEAAGSITRLATVSHAVVAHSRRLQMLGVGIGIGIVIAVGLRPACSITVPIAMPIPIPTSEVPPCIFATESS